MTPAWLDARWLGWLSDILLHSVWLGAAAALLTWLGAVAIRRPGPRHAIAVAACVLLAAGLLAVATLCWPGATTTVGEALVIRPPAAHLGIIAAQPGGTEPAMPSAAASAPAPALWRMVVALVWLAGMAFLSLRHCHGWWLVARLRRGTRQASTDLIARVAVLATRLGIRPPALRFQDRLQVPAVIGWWRPMILLPGALATGLTTDQLEALLLHELAHLRRRDWIIEILVGFLETVLFFHPAVRWMGRRLRADRERCCDALALGAGADALGFAKALLALAEQATTPTPILAASGGILAERIREILGMPRRPDGALRALVLILALPVVLALASACTHRTAAPAAEAPAAVVAPAAETRPTFSLQRRIRARSSGLMIAQTLRQIEGTRAAIARCGIPVAGPAVILSGPGRVAIEQALIASDGITISHYPGLTSFPLQIANASLVRQYAYLADYRMAADTLPDPQVSVLNYGQIWESCCDWEGRDPSLADGILVNMLRVNDGEFLGVERFSFTHHRTKALPAAGTGGGSIYSWEEPVCAVRRSAALPSAVRLGPDDLLFVPTVRTIQRHPPTLHRTVTGITRQGGTIDTRTGADRTIAFLFTGRTVAAPLPSFIRYDATPVVWMEMPITLAARDEPLPQVIARLKALLPVPVTFHPDAEHATLRVSINTANEPLRVVLERLLPQTMLVARAQPGALRIELDDNLKDFPAGSMGVPITTSGPPPLPHRAE